MQIALVVALDRSGLIGREGGLPWHLPADLRHFKALTMGKALIMGRATYESIGRPLPGRFNIVMTRQRGYQAPGCFVAGNKVAALAAAAAHVSAAMGREASGTSTDGEEVMVIGGASIYRLFMTEAQRIYLTRVEGEFEGDVYFPRLLADKWRIVAEEVRSADERNPYQLHFLTLERRAER